ncbi:MAG: hypothetical protein U5J63_02385 [Fodinibius sp.]|nr:hypothetical protein [Fodinibius sp.]
MNNTNTKITVLAAVIGIILPVLTMAQQAPLAERADSLYDAFAEEQALDRYKQLLEAKPNNYRALWRTSFLYSRVGNRLDDKDDQRKYFNQAIDYAEQALQVDSTDSQSNFVMAVAMGRKAIISGARERVAASRAIKKYADRAIQYDSTNAGAWHVLGRWNLKVANLSWIERAAANTLFGVSPAMPATKKQLNTSQEPSAITINTYFIITTWLRHTSRWGAIRKQLRPVKRVTTAKYDSR